VIGNGRAVRAQERDLGVEIHGRLTSRGCQTLLPLADRFAILNSMVQYSTTVDRTFAALADPTRRAVVERLGGGSASISELAEPFGISLTGMRKHVQILEDAGLVTTEKVGRTRRCSLAPRPLAHVEAWMQQLDRFEALLERTKGAL
jgi:DNA-binding transcriptional ArsR family regulator